jgi:hypothetical protein
MPSMQCPNMSASPTADDDDDRTSYRERLHQGSHAAVSGGTSAAASPFSLASEAFNTPEGILRCCYSLRRYSLKKPC